MVYANELLDGNACVVPVDSDSRILVRKIEREKKNHSKEALNFLLLCVVGSRRVRLDSPSSYASSSGVLCVLCRNHKRTANKLPSPGLGVVVSRNGTKTTENQS